VLDVTPPGAILTLDGKAIGPANGFHQELPAGPHALEVSADGYAATKQTVTIVAGETLRVPLDLAQIPRPPPLPTKGTLALDVTPTGAILTLDGKAIGPANGFHQELPAGPHALEISADGHATTKQTVTIVAGETLRVPLDLALIRPSPEPPTKGTLVLDVTPRDSTVTLDGKVIGVAKDFHQELPVGAHEVEISADGYVATKRTVMIVGGETLGVPLDLALIPPSPEPPTKGTLVLDDVKPTGAILRLDGRQIGLAKGFRQDLPEGPHLIEISATGYATAKRTVTITAGKTLPVSLSLAALRQPPRPREERPLPTVVPTPIHPPPPVAPSPPVHPPPSVATMNAHPTIPLPPP
jgi:hypothetical protein